MLDCITRPNESSISIVCPRGRILRGLMIQVSLYNI